MNLFPGPKHMPSTPYTTTWHLRAEMVRMVEALAALLKRHRRRSRTPTADALRGYVIEDGEAEGLLDRLTPTTRRGSDQDIHQ